MEQWQRDLLRARDINVALPLSLHSLDDVAAFWRKRVHYQWDGPDHVVLDAVSCWERGYGACADAAASLAAAAAAQGKRAQLCIEQPPHVEGYKHVRVYVDGVAYDPYSRYRPTLVGPDGQPVVLPETCEKRVWL